MFNTAKKNVPVQKVEAFSSSFEPYELHVLREDLIHPHVSGNKFRKLKYNIKEAKLQKKSSLLTFGGAFSNHIAATAAAGKETGLATIGVIRGEELINSINDNPTLFFAQQCGMQFHFVDRETYKQKTEPLFLEQLENKFGDFYVLPEGGTNHLAVKGCEEILSAALHDFDYLCVSVGTGGTLAGLVRAAKEHQKVLGFSALKGTFQQSEVKKYTSKTHFEILDDYCFGGYGKIDAVLVRFMNNFTSKTNIPLDPVYTGKMMYGIFEMMEQRKFKENSRILAIHTGGLQGIAGMNQLLKKKQLPQIE
ncbi:MAG: pyridoxal-phosphate dependent enzyme [Flavobacteriaceae bacterium]